MRFISTRGAMGVALALVMTVPAWAGGFQLQSQGAAFAAFQFPSFSSNR